MPVENSKVNSNKATVENVFQSDICRVTDSTVM